MYQERRAKLENKLSGAKFVYSIFLVLNIVMPIVMPIAMGEPIAFLAGIIGSLPLTLIAYLFKRGYEKKIIKLNEEEKAEARRKIEEEQEKKREFFKSGQWEFPSKEFYIQCEKDGFASLSKEGAYEKAKLVAKKFVREGRKKHYCDLSCESIYLKKALITNYFETGKKLAAAEKEEKEKTPQKGFLSIEQTEQMNLFKKLKSKHGREKRIAYLNAEIKKLKKEISEKKISVEKMKEFIAIVRTSANTQKEINWALWGGIADGLAGPAAGLATALEMQQKNAEIRAQNAASKAFVEEWSRDAIKCVAKVDSEIWSIECEVDKLKKELSDTEIKLVLTDTDTKTLFEELKIEAKYEYFYNHSEVTATIKRPKASSPYCLDGILEAQLYCDNILVDKIPIALPIYGLKQKESTTITAYSPKYMVGRYRDYRVKIGPAKLWLIES